MQTEIKYKNAFGELSLQQVESSGSDYSREQYLNGELKRIDEFEGGQMVYGSYYLSEGEDAQAILTELAGVWENVEIFTPKETVGEYSVRNWTSYHGIEQIKAGKNVYDSKNREIARQCIDILTGDITSVTKTFHLKTFGGFIDSGDVMNFGTIEFDYIYSMQIPGQIRVMIYLPGYELKEYYLSGEKNVLLERLIREVFIWENHPYYHSASPLVPSSTV